MKSRGEGRLPAVARNEEPAAVIFYKCVQFHKIWFIPQFESTIHLLDVGKLQTIIFQIWGEEVKAEPTMSIDCRSRVLKIHTRC